MNYELYLTFNFYFVFNVPVCNHCIFSVLVPVFNLTFSVNNTFVKDGDTITLTSYPSTDTSSLLVDTPVITSTVPILCRSHGGNPRPDLHMYYSSTSITGLFVYNKSSVLEGSYGLYEEYHVTELRNDSFIVTRDYHDALIRCTATLPDGQETSIAVKIKLTCKWTMPNF